MISLGAGIRGITKCPACNGTGEVPDNDTTKIAIIFDRWFIAPDELNKFCKSIGYENPDYPNDFDLMFDPRVVQFASRTWRNYGENMYTEDEKVAILDVVLEAQAILER